MTKFKISLYAISAALVLFFAAKGFSGEAKDNSQSISNVVSKPTALPNLTLKDSSGKLVKFDSFKGKKVFVNLWATWCGPCRREMPSIDNLAKKLKKEKVAFVMLALDDDFRKSVKYIQTAKFSLPVYYPASPMPEMFNVPAIPTTFIFDEKGELIKTIEGSVNYDTEEYVKLLSGK